MKNKYDGLEIAVIGMSGQFPGSKDCRSYWENLMAGKELIKTFTDEELINCGVPESQLRNESYIKCAGAIDIDEKNTFDHSFFGYSPEEASLMDPQIRLFHEHCWKALEDAGYSSLIDKQRIGLFAGASRNYNWKMYVYGKSEETRLDPFYLDMISGASFISTLVSYKLNLQGSSFFVDTACSTSMVAISLACKSLLFGESKMALAGGSCIITQKQKGYFYQEGMINSSDGHCRAFDKDASGTVGGEGVGVVVLKKLSEAIKDRDHIYCIIRSASINNDGNRKVGYTAPSVKGQTECIKMSHRLAGVDPRTISYIETHGTGTKLGDPVEVRALNEAFAGSGKEKFCAIGSVKTNIGHLDTAAGVAGFIKTVLSLKYKKIPPSLYYKEPNPEIDFDGGPFYVNTELKEWERKGDFPLRAAVSSFGIGGTNVHAVLEEAPDSPPVNEGRQYKLLTFSAKTEASLLRYMNNVREFLIKEPLVNLADMCYTLQVGRKHFSYRKSLACEDKEELINMLSPDNLQTPSTIAKEKNSSLVFMFSGAGSQYINMGKDLYEKEPFFREEMDKGFSLLKSLTGENYKEIIYPKQADNFSINLMLHTQPSIFLFGYSLVRLLMSWGIKPQYMIGHSIGEYIAACISGVFSFEDALLLVVKRGQLMNDMPPGNMLSVPINQAEAHKYVNNKISLAAINGPDQVVLSGDTASIDELIKTFEQTGISYIKLYASQAGHSHMIDDIADEYRKTLETIRRNAPGTPFVSNLTGEIMSADQATSVNYWVRHMRETVQFSGGIKTLLAQKNDLTFVEVGGGHSLTTLVRQHQTKKNKPVAINLIKHPTKEFEDDVKYLTERIGQLWSHGVSIDWMAYYNNEKRQRISLPAYSFELTRYPTEVDPFENSDRAVPSANPSGNQELKDWIYYPVWKSAMPISSGKKTNTKSYIFFSTDDAFAEGIKSGLRKGKNELVELLMGEQYKKLSRYKYIIDPAIPDHYKKLFNEIRNDQIDITDIVYSWGMTIDSSKLELNKENKEMNLVYFGIVEITRSLLQDADLNKKRITVITNSLHCVTGNEVVSYGQSLMLGLMNTLPQEYSISCCNIDINLQEKNPGLAEKLAQEINNRGNERIIALRHDKRWILDYQRHAGAIRDHENRIKQRGTYLITGGLGNVGFILAKHLIQNYDANVVLTGRRRIKEDADTNEETGKGSARLDYLKSIGKNVTYLNTDVSDFEIFKSTTEIINKNIGRIDGIIHTAGNIDLDHFELIEDITPQNAFAIFAPKVKGVVNIYKLFKDADPDFVWITSSLATVLAGLNYASYSSANLYMDHFVSSISKELPNWKCIGLGEMLFTEDEIKRENDWSRKALRPLEITELFEWSLSVEHCPVILETAVDLHSRIKKAYHTKRENYLDFNASDQVATKSERPDLSNAYVAPETETEIKLAKMIEDFFGIVNIGMEDNFFELGGDSLKAMVLLRRIKKEFNINIPLKDFFGSRNLKLIAGEIDERIWINKPSEKQFVSIV
jgi:acyl transferase domain-containing protein/acyl carrier protein